MRQIYIFPVFGRFCLFRKISHEHICGVYIALCVIPCRQDILQGADHICSSGEGLKKLSVHSIADSGYNTAFSIGFWERTYFINDILPVFVKILFCSHLILLTVPAVFCVLQALPRFWHALCL